MVILLVLPLFLVYILVFTLGETRSFSWPSWTPDSFLGYYISPVVTSSERPSDQLRVAAEPPLISSSKPNETVLDLPQLVVT